jgi:uncharacterized protein YndB with AHSA1/START domain
MAPIVETIEIDRPPEEVFSYLSDPCHMSEWQETALSVHKEKEGPAVVGSRFKTDRRFGVVKRTMTSEVRELEPPRSWSIRGVDGPVRANVDVTVEPSDGSAHSRVTVNLDFEGRGLVGKLLVPLVVRPQAKATIHQNGQQLKERIESGS